VSQQPIIMDSAEAAEADSERALAALGVTREQVLAELDYRQRMKEEAMLKRLAAAQRAGGERRAIKTPFGEGYQDMMIDPVSYHYWGRRLGYECWECPQFRREYLRDNAQCRVKTIGSVGMETAAMALNRRKAPAAKPAPAPTRRSFGRRGRWAA
jgi:hypothetical protein